MARLADRVTPPPPARVERVNIRESACTHAYITHVAGVNRPAVDHLHKRVRGSVSKICFFVVHTSSFSHIFLHAMLTLHVARSHAFTRKRNTRYSGYYYLDFCLPFFTLADWTQERSPNSYDQRLENNRLDYIVGDWDGDGAYAIVIEQVP